MSRHPIVIAFRYFRIAALCLAVPTVISATAAIGEYQAEPIAWGVRSNSFRVGWMQVAKKPDLYKPPVVLVAVYLETSETNATRKYVASPHFKFAKLELRDAKGKLINAARRNKLDGPSPERIMAKDLPRTRETLRRAGMIEGMLLLPM